MLVGVVACAAFAGYSVVQGEAVYGEVVCVACFVLEDDPALVGLLLVDDELVVLVEQLLPSEGKKVADAEPKNIPQPMRRQSAYFSSR